MRWQPLCFFLLCCTACHHSTVNEAQRFKIRLTPDSQSVCIIGLEYAIIHDLKADSLTQGTWKSLFAIYRMPTDTDMKDFQPEQPGKYQISDSAITFKPDTPFKKHQQYFVRFYGNGAAISSLKLIQAKANLKGPGYLEVVFKF